jgi:hypothetical protein
MPRVGGFQSFGSNPTPSPCTPIFGTYDEAHGYASHLVFKHNFIRSAEIKRSEEPFNAYWHDEYQPLRWGLAAQTMPLMGSSEAHHEGIKFRVHDLQSS